MGRKEEKKRRVGKSRREGVDRTGREREKSNSAVDGKRVGRKKEGR